MTPNKKFDSLNKVQKIVITLSFLVFIISLTQPAFFIDRKDYDAYSDAKYLLLLGWMGVLGGSIESLIWWANPIYFLALLLFFKNNKFSIPLSFFATLLAYKFSTFKEILTSESGEKSKIISLELGYKLWVASFVILFIGTLLNLLIKKSK